MNASTLAVRGTMLFFCLAFGTSAGAAVTLDPTFGNLAGTATISQGNMLSENVRDIAVDATGRIVLAGYVDQPPSSSVRNNFALAVARLTAGGLPDLTFSGDGKLYMPTCAPSANGPGGTWLPKVAIQPDGKIVVGATCLTSSYEQIVLVRFLTDGTLDSSFDGDGILYLPNPDADRGSRFGDLAIQADAKIVVAGTYGTMNSNPRMGVVLRFNSAGTPDATFATQGTYTTGERTTLDVVELMADGRIVAGGYTSNVGATDSDIYVTRLSASGALDATFGTQGVVARNIGIISAPLDPSIPTMDLVYAIAARPDGRLLIGGTSRGSGGLPRYEPLMMQLTSTGALDAGWGQSGYVSLGGVPNDHNVMGIYLLANGDAIVGGTALPVTHVNSAGLGTSNDSAPHDVYGVALQNGKAVVAVSTASPISTDFRAMRFDFSAQFDSTPDAFGFAQFFIEPLGVPRQSDTVTITGIATSTDVSTVNGEFSIACTGTFVAAGETRLIQNNTVLCLRHTNSDSSNTKVTTSLTVGGASADWSTTTGDGSPDGLTYASRTGVATSTAVTSAAVTVTGINMPVRLMISGGEHSVGCTGTYSTSDVQIINNQTLCLRHTSAAAANTTTTTTVHVGDVVATFASTTAVATTPPPGGGSSSGGGGGGGGGSFDWALLALLAALTFRKVGQRQLESAR